MDLTCYVFPGWEPRIRPASSKRDWMDEAPEAFPYRCLPLNIANSHGWEILSPCGFEVVWKGGMGVDDVIVRADPGARVEDIPVSLFGRATFTFHVQGLFRTSPGWNLWVSGSPNSAKDGAVPLAGVVETDWSPYTFTMNWKLTRPGHPVRFEENEPFAHIFPIPRKAIEEFEPSFAAIDDNPELKAQFQAWSRSRDAFHERMRTNPPDNPSEKWQKLYYRGQDPDGQCPIADHQSKLRVRDFAGKDLTGSAEAAIRKPVAKRPAPVAAETAIGETIAERPVPAAAEPDRAAGWPAAKLAWVLKTQERQRALSTIASGVLRRVDVSSEDFLDNHYATSRPVVLGNVVSDWPACKKWTPEYLLEKIGDRTVEYQGDRTSAADFEMNKDRHKRSSSFAEFMNLIMTAKDNDYYITAYNSAVNQEALRCLGDDLGTLDDYLRHEPGRTEAMFWIGPKNTFTPLHHDLTNNLLVQFVGRKRVILVSPGETPRLYNDLHVFSRIKDLTAADFATFPLLNGVGFQEIILNPGDALFIPIGWWHQVTSLDFSVSATHTNFKWPNEGWQDHPEANPRS
jgi:hypothetical protein